MRILAIGFLLLLSGCTDKPRTLDENLEQYERLARLVATSIDPGIIMNLSEAEGILRKEMSELKVYRVRHEQDGSAVLLSGSSNIFTGQFSYIYRLGDSEIDMAENQTDGIERKHLHGRWYAEEASFD